MEEWKKKLTDDADELKTKLDKLFNFINSSKYCKLEFHNQYLLTQQLEAMRSYYRILKARISLFD